MNHSKLRIDEVHTLKREVHNFVHKQTNFD